MAKVQTLRFFTAFTALTAFLACAPTKQLCPASFRVDFVEALQFADAADLAYQTVDSVARACPAGDSCFVRTGGVTKAQVIVLRNDVTKVQWIGFRGTAVLTDVQLDVNYTELPDSGLGIYLHSGFAAAANDLLPMVLPLLKPDYQTNISGHSLGGAIAAITALRLQKQGYAVKIRTFGQPKTTNFQGAEQVAQLDMIRFIDDRDVVPLMPPLDWKPGQALGSYAHFAREVDLQAQGYECLMRHYYPIDIEYWKSGLRKETLQDHGMALYRERIAKLAAVSVNN